MKNVITIGLAVIAAGAVSYFMPAHSGAASAQKSQSVYERVIQSGILRCGYFEEAPFTILDPNTGKKSGIAIELAEKIAEDLRLKIEWVLVSNFGAITEDLRNGRYDALCASTYNLPRAGRIDYTIPYAYAPVYAYTQEGRADFDNKLDRLDWSKVTVAGLDGEGATTVAREKVPQAHFSILPENSQIADMLMNVASKKADITFMSPAVFKDFAKNNPHKLQRVATARPFHVFNVGFGLKPDEAAFKNILDVAMRNMESSGYLRELFDTYDPEHLLFQPAALF